MFTGEQSKILLEKANLSQRRDSKRLFGVTYQHLNLVLNGHRHSQRLLAKVDRELRKRGFTADDLLASAQ